MSIRARASIVAAAALGLLLGGPVGTVMAKKNVVKASFDGKKRKFKGRFVIGSYSGNGTIVVAAKPARFGRTVRTLGVGCPIYPPTTSFPLTMTFCNANYTEQKVSRNPRARGWLNVNTTTVTYDSFDGARLRGSFSTVLAPVTGTSESLTVEGTFDAKVTGQ